MIKMPFSIISKTCLRGCRLPRLSCSTIKLALRTPRSKMCSSNCNVLSLILARILPVNKLCVSFACAHTAYSWRACEFETRARKSIKDQAHTHNLLPIVPCSGHNARACSQPRLNISIPCRKDALHLYSRLVETCAHQHTCMYFYV